MGDIQFTGRTREVTLPYSGETWTVLTRPTPLDAARLAPFILKLSEETARLTEELGIEVRDDYPALASMTTEWSFPEPVSVEAIMGRDLEDMVAILEVFVEETLPFLDKVTSSKSFKASTSNLGAKKASRRNGRKPTSSTKPAGAGRSSKKPQTTSPSE